MVRSIGSLAEGCSSIPLESAFLILSLFDKFHYFV
jgi:hypothetical protein